MPKIKRATDAIEHISCRLLAEPRSSLHKGTLACGVVSTKKSKPISAARPTSKITLYFAFMARHREIPNRVFHKDIIYFLLPPFRRHLWVVMKAPLGQFTQGIIRRSKVSFIVFRQRSLKPVTKLSLRLWIAHFIILNEAIVFSRHACCVFWREIAERAIIFKVSICKLPTHFRAAGNVTTDRAAFWTDHLIAINPILVCVIV